MKAMLPAEVPQAEIPRLYERLASVYDVWGLLTESLQVRGAIALSQIERNGIALDQPQVESTKKFPSTFVGRRLEESAITRFL